MEVSFECPICLEEYNSEYKPLIMPCGHNACIECLTGIAKTGAIACPTCRTTHNSINVNSLTVNYALMPSGPIKPKINSVKQYILDHMNIIQQQLKRFNNADSSLRNDYDLAQRYNRRCHDDANDKIDWWIATLQNLKKRFNTLIEESDKINEQNLNQKINAIKVKIDERNELMEDLQKAYNDETQLSARSKLNLRNLHDIQSFETQFTYYTYSELPDPTFSQILNNSGVSISVQQIISLEEIKPTQPVYQQISDNKVAPKEKIPIVIPPNEEEEFVIKRKNPPETKKIPQEEKEGLPKEKDFPEPKKFVKSRGVTELKKFFCPKEEEKDENPIQPRQRDAEKPQTAGWFVQNRFMTFVAVEPWMSTQLDEGKNQGKVEFEIFDPIGNKSYKVNLNEQKSYRWHSKLKGYINPRKLEYRA